VFESVPEYYYNESRFWRKLFHDISIELRAGGGLNYLDDATMGARVFVECGGMDHMYSGTWEQMSLVSSSAPLISDEITG